jgi:hypothetical protein
MLFVPAIITHRTIFASAKGGNMKRIIFTLLLLLTATPLYAEIIDNGDSTVTDTATGLIWEKLGNGVNYKSLTEAINRIVELNKGPGATWRIPAKMEFLGIDDYLLSVSSFRNQSFWTLETCVYIFPNGAFSYPTCGAARVLAVRSQALPVANAGPDKTVFDVAILDGSSSFASDSTIASYQWLLRYRGSSINNRTAEGVNPIISNLNAGFYDVTLTITDNFGAFASDTMLLGVAGNAAILEERSRWDANGDNKIGIEEAIRALQIISGIRQ